MGALKAQRLMAVAGLWVAPALAGGLIAYQHLGTPGQALLIGVAILLAAVALEPRHLPAHLMPLGGIALRACVPPLGMGAALVLGALLEPLPTSVIGPALAGSWLVLAFAICLQARLEPGLKARLAVIGPPRLALSLERELRMSGADGYEVVGWIDPAPDAAPGALRARLGSVAELRSIVQTNRIDLLVNGVDRRGGRSEMSEISSREALEHLAASCLDLPVKLIAVNQLYEALFGHVPLATTRATWFQYVLHPRFQAASPFAKRATDLVLGAIAALVAAPLVAVAALAIKLEDGGPVLFRQRRIGEGGRPFEIFKLRTMREESGSESAWTQAGDARVTRVGRLLRRTHVDELPQLWNVIWGRMSLVGPRPEQPELVGALEHRLPFYDRRHLMKPGITGWAQIRCGYAGSDAGTTWKLCHDLYYFKRRTLAFDVLIMLEAVTSTLLAAQFGRRRPERVFVLDAAPDPEGASR
jgi:exopolysaccharide biosynthesis polyprenyl glycosylphosphotransferase